MWEVWYLTLLILIGIVSFLIYINFIDGPLDKSDKSINYYLVPIAILCFYMLWTFN